MEPLVWLVLAAVVATVLIFVSLLKRSRREGKEKQEDTAADEGQPADEGELVPRQQRRARNLQARAAALRRARAAGGGQENEEEEENPVGGDDGEFPFQKIGTKKLRKIKEKAERKAMREQEEAMREDRKKREALREKDRKRAEEQEKAQKEREEEEQKRQREEKERVENEAYLKLKETFVVEEEGEQAEDEDEERGVQDFIDFIKGEKVVYLENLASEFNLRTQDAIDRVQKLQESGELTGVIDDRGKFIFISEEEMAAVATFIRQRGRVSLAELASSSNSLINLQPAAET